STTDLRRPLVLGFVLGTVLYLGASIASWPRAGLALLGGAIGLAAMVVLGAAGGTASAGLFAIQLLLVALTLGSVNAAMLLGHRPGVGHGRRHRRRQHHLPDRRTGVGRPMQVLARCFAILRELSVERTELSLADGAAVADAWSALAARYPALEPHREYVRAAR